MKLCTHSFKAGMTPLVLLIAMPALAQGAAAPLSSTMSAASDERQGGVGDIIVTAQRREQSLQNVAVAVTALDAASLAASGVATSEDLQISTPNLVQTTVNGTTQMFIRGVGSQSALIGGESSVATYVDGVYIASLTGAAFSFNNIERVEVLRGPQGTLFGRNATGGVIQVVTKIPGQQPEFSVDLSYANYQTFTASAYASGGLASNVAASIAVFSTTQNDGWGRNINTGADLNKRNEHAARAKLVFDPTDNLRIILSADYAHQENDIGANRTTYPGSRTILGGEKVGGRYDGNFNLNPVTFNTQYGVSGNISLDLGGTTLSSITAYRNYSWYNTYDQDSTPVRFIDVVRDEESETFQQELLLETTIGPADLTAGLFYLNTKAGIDPISTQGSMIPSVNVGRISRQKLESYAAFGQASVELLKDFTLTAGLRYTDESAVLNGQLLALPGNPLPAGTILAEVVDKKLSASKVTWRFATDYRLMDAILLYGSASRGFKTGGFNLTSITQTPTRPETLDAYEVGVKADLFDRQLRFNMAGFHYDYSDIQLSTVTSGGIQTLNAARARIRGLEVEATAVPHLPTGRLQLGLNLTLMDGKYRSFPDAPYYLPSPYTSVPPGLTCPTPTSAAPGGNAACTFDASGKDVIRAPKWTANVSLSYALPIGNDELEVSANYFYNDGFYWETSNRIRQDGYHLLNAQIAYRLSDNLQFRVFGRNLTDELYYSQLSEQAMGDISSAAAPRTYGFGLNFTY